MSLFRIFTAAAFCLLLASGTPQAGRADDKDKEKDDLIKKDMTAIAAKKNVVGKVSGFVATAPERGKAKIEDLAPIINHTMDAFGPDRVMFGGDWPVCLLGVAKYADWATALMTLVKDRPEEQQKKLFHDNAVKFYGLA